MELENFKISRTSNNNSIIINISSSFKNRAHNSPTNKNKPHTKITHKQQQQRQHYNRQRRYQQHQRQHRRKSRRQAAASSKSPRTTSQRRRTSAMWCADTTIWRNRVFSARLCRPAITACPTSKRAPQPQPSPLVASPRLYRPRPLPLRPFFTRPTRRATRQLLLLVTSLMSITQTLLVLFLLIRPPPISLITPFYIIVSLFFNLFLYIRH